MMKPYWYLMKIKASKKVDLHEAEGRIDDPNGRNWICVKKVAAKTAEFTTHIQLYLDDCSV